MDSFLFLFLLFVAGIALSAFFSGSETGYYRATRVRLAMDAFDGRVTTRSLMWLANNPVMFVATVLVGNNLANYLVSYAIILGVAYIGQEGNVPVELLAPIAVTPLVFVYGELLPKELFFNAPNRLLRAGTPLFVFFGVILLPITLVLWLLGRMLTMLVGESPEKLRRSLARSELQRLFDEGKDEGVLLPAQRELAQTMFEFANKPLSQFWKQASRIPTVQQGTTTDVVFQLTHRTQSTEVLVHAEKSRTLIGYVRVMDLYMNKDDDVRECRPFPEVAPTQSPLSVMRRLQSERESLARVIDENGKTVGIVALQSLTDAVWNTN
ncbi:CNNM domain-containing protein [Planctomycetota bacterium]